MDGVTTEKWKILFIDHAHIKRFNMWMRIKTFQTYPRSLSAKATAQKFGIPLLITWHNECQWHALNNGILNKYIQVATKWNIVDKRVEIVVFWHEKQKKYWPVLLSTNNSTTENWEVALYSIVTFKDSM